MQLIQCVKLIKLFKSVVSLRPYFSKLRNGSLCISRVALLRIKHGNEQLTQMLYFALTRQSDIQHLATNRIDLRSDTKKHVNHFSKYAIPTHKRQICKQE
jgi:hypothetical protein